MKISITVPAYNEEGNIEELYSRLLKVIKKLKLKQYELLFVDDGSTDQTVEKIKLLRSRDKNVHYVSFSRNFGHQAALRAGIAHCTGEAIITMDADLQHPPELIIEMITRWQDGYDIVYTRRKDTTDTNIYKRWSSKYFYKLLNRLSGLAIEEGAADFRLIDAKVANVINNLPETSLFLRGFISWCGFRVFAIDYQPDKRFSGKSKYSVRNMIALAMQGVTQFSIKPLRLASFLGFISAFTGVLYGIYIAWSYFANHALVSGWTSVIVSVLVIGGLQLIILGIMGEYLGRTFMQTKQRPDYIIREHV